MFVDFFYLIRQNGIDVSLQEWLTLIEALDKGLCNSSLMDFYYVCRSIIVKTEADFDKFDIAFAQYFKDIKHYEDIPEEILKWLENPKNLNPNLDIERAKKNANLTLEELQKMLKERIKEQKERHDYGTYWIGTGGASVMGHSGYSPKGIRVGGESQRMSALQAAEQRNFRDFRDDNVLSFRKFQMAFRRLRQFSSRIDGAKTQLNLDKTIDETCNNAGNLKLVFERPRQNTVKLLVLFDSGGSMWKYSKLCTILFQAVSKSNHFKDLKVYYFHNCPYDKLYTDPHCIRGKWIDTQWVLKNLSKDYKVIFVGDASMSPTELLNVGGSFYTSYYNEEPGIDWLKKFKKKYEKIVWLNPILKSDWYYAYGYQTIKYLSNEFNMFELTIQDLENALKYLLVSK